MENRRSPSQSEPRVFRVNNPLAYLRLRAPFETFDTPYNAATALKSAGTPLQWVASSTH